MEKTIQGMTIIEYENESAPATILLDSVNHPKHYNQGKIEVIDAIEDWNLGFNLGNAIKYIARAGKKDINKLKEDLEKAKWYLEREIKRNSKDEYNL